MNITQSFSAVQAAMAKVGIDKSGVNQQQKYKYRGIDQVMNTLGPILAEHQVLIVPNVTDHAMELRQSARGGNMYHHTVTVEYIIFGPDGDSMGPFKAKGECIDSSDKGMNKACSAAYKYWVLATLCVPIEGQDDADSSTPEEAAIEYLSHDQQRNITAMALTSETDLQAFVEWLGYETLTTVPASEFGRACIALQKKLDKMSDAYAQEQVDTNRSMQ